MTYIYARCLRNYSAGLRGKKHYIKGKRSIRGFRTLLLPWRGHRQMDADFKAKIQVRFNLCNLRRLEAPTFGICG